MAESELSMKLVVDTVKKRVLFAKVDRECFDFLHSILSMPLSKLILLLEKQGLVGNMYETLKRLNESHYTQRFYSQRNHTSRNGLRYGYSRFLLTTTPPTVKNVKKKNLYRCRFCYYNNNTSARETCRNCAREMTTKSAYKGPPIAEKQPIMVMDDLTIRPPSISLLAEFNIKDVSSLEERVVKLGVIEAVKLWKASFELEEILSSVFVWRNTIDAA